MQAAAPLWQANGDLAPRVDAAAPLRHNQMMSLFSRKPQDPLAAQLRELERRERRLREEIERVQSAINLPPAPGPAAPVEILPPPQDRVARRPSPLPGKNHRILGVERRRIRRRVIAISLTLLVLALIIYRAAS